MFTSVFLGVAACGQLVRVSLVSGPSSFLIHSYRRNGVSDGITIFAIIFAIVSHDERREKSWVGKISIPGEPKKNYLRGSMTKEIDIYPERPAFPHKVPISHPPLIMC